MSRIKTSMVRSIAILGAIISSCANPTAIIQSEIDRFKKEYPGHIHRYQGKTRTMQYAWSGDPTKQPILFVHGSPGSWEGWAHFLLNPHLQSNFHLIAIDRPGYGGSGAGQSETSVMSQVEDILSVLQFNRSGKPAILVGHSFGGPVIARAAMVHPEMVYGLVFVASSVDPALEETKWIQYPARWWLIRSLIPDALRVCNEEIFPLKNELLEMLPYWKKITAKAVLIQGGRDELVPPGNQDFLVNHLRTNTVINVVRVPELDHFVPWKRPDLILDALDILGSVQDSQPKLQNH